MLSTYLYFLPIYKFKDGWWNREFLIADHSSRGHAVVEKLQLGIPATETGIEPAEKIFYLQ